MAMGSFRAGGSPPADEILLNKIDVYLRKYL